MFCQFLISFENFLIIQGASGAGKTTLLNVINFRNRGNLKVKGTVKINGQPVSSAGAIASISGYVQQEANLESLNSFFIILVICYRFTFSGPFHRYFDGR